MVCVSVSVELILDMMMVANDVAETEKEKERKEPWGGVGMDDGGEVEMGSQIDSPDKTMDENSDPHGMARVWYYVVSKYPPAFAINVYATKNKNNKNTTKYASQSKRKAHPTKERREAEKSRDRDRILSRLCVKCQVCLSRQSLQVIVFGSCHSLVHPVHAYR